MTYTSSSKTKIFSGLPNNGKSSRGGVGDIPLKPAESRGYLSLHVINLSIGGGLYSNWFVCVCVTNCKHVVHA